MENDIIWYDCFLETLYEKFPQRTQLTQALMNLLSIEREAVYRRLRKDVIFPVQEIVKIASAWNISLDEITGINSGQIPFLMQKINYVNPSEKELSQLQEIIQFLYELKDSPDAEYMEVGNKISRTLLAGFEHLNRFCLFKWMYQYGDFESVVPFSGVIPSEKQRNLTAEYCHVIKNLPNVSYIWDYLLFDYLVCDIRYFYSIQLVTDEEKELIKKDLLAFLDYMVEVAGKGFFPETKNKVNLYISRICIDTNYSYMYTDKVKICRVHVFGKNEIYTCDPEMMINFKSWMQSKKRSSTQISEVDERHRIEFFTKQRQLIDSL